MAAASANRETMAVVGSGEKSTWKRTSMIRRSGGHKEPRRDSNKVVPKDQREQSSACNQEAPELNSQLLTLLITWGGGGGGQSQRRLCNK